MTWCRSDGGAHCGDDVDDDGAEDVGNEGVCDGNGFGDVHYDSSGSTGSVDVENDSSDVNG